MESSLLSAGGRAPWGRRIGESVTLRVTLLLAVVVAATSCLAWIAFEYESYRGLTCLLTAASVCFCTGAIKLLYNSLACKTDARAFHHGFGQVAWGLIFRMGVPLLLCGIVAIEFGQPLARSLARYLLVIYPLALFTETWLTVKQRGQLEAGRVSPGALGQRGPRTA